MFKTLFPIPKDLLNKLRKVNSEATVRQLVIGQLNCPDIILEEGKSDALHENILFEFKLDKDMRTKEGDRADVLAQVLYYCRNFYVDGKRVPPYVALIDKDEFVIYDRASIESIYKDEKLFADKDSSASNPSIAVIEKARSVDAAQYIFSATPANLDEALQRLRQIVHAQILIADDITHYNVENVYHSWSNIFERFLDPKGREEQPHVFQKDSTTGGQVIKIESGLFAGNEVITVEFTLDNEIAKIERCPKHQYEEFWKRWNRITDRKYEKIIFQKIYNLFNIEVRRKKGQFYTPTNLARHGWDYLVKELGENFWFDGTWRIWDCSCGEGGLAINVIPNSALQYTYLSSLDSGEVDFVRKHLPMCKKVWKMDFLNTLTQDFPAEVKTDMENPNIKWVFFINPPYGEGSSGKATSKSEEASWFQKGRSLSLVKEQMKNHNMSVESKEKYAQFLFRIEKEFKGKYVLGSYTTMKAFVSKEYSNLRKFWRPVFKKGLICCANKWHQGNGAFPSVFSVFDCREKGKWGEMTYNILEYRKGNANGVFKGKKTFAQEDPKRSFRHYFFPNEGLLLDELSVVQSNGLKTFGGKEKTNNYRPKETLASAYFGSAFLRRQDFSWMVSGAYISHNCFINKQNYKRILCGMGLFWSIKHTWLNHEQSLLDPSRDLTLQEQSDAVLYALLSERNRCTTARLPFTPNGITVGKKTNVPNGGIVENKLNPFDKKLFDWQHLSETGKKALEEYRKYCDDVVGWEHYETVMGVGKWGGHYLYERTKNGLDLTNAEVGNGFALPQSFKDAREELRQSVEKTALELCF